MSRRLEANFAESQAQDARLVRAVRQGGPARSGTCPASAPHWSHAQAPQPSPPADRRHKARNAAVVTIDGRDRYLGPYGTPASHESYARLIAEWRFGRSRRLINKDVHRVRAMFRWAAGEELDPGASLAALAAVAGLEKGRGDAKEPPPIRPVAEAAVEATLPHLSRQVAAMVRFQVLTAARPGEVCAIRPGDVDRPEGVWIDRPGSHQTEHHGRERAIAIEPSAQEVLAPWLDRGPDVHCLCPAEVVAERGPSCRGRAARPMPGGRYSRNSYRAAVNRACDRAFPHPTSTPPAPTNSSRRSPSPT
ncbi:site-specific integrase [Paludisphaera mucosa]|uniref:Site-specific integrase n=1 Tax=Paludisphaera mucosa TaxID=3030827 RepID=A0ABT6F9V1_9BACT|nr:site-specific integrase [Paludisphaera mucosa]MDG3004373.1 site-specific integrase [Paludisphaera mucosa]